jgi:hypothetical protein
VKKITNEGGFNLTFYMHRIGAIFASIWINKLFYYVLKYFALQTAVLSGAMFGIPIWVQLTTSAVFSVYLFLMYKKQTK